MGTNRAYDQVGRSRATSENQSLRSVPDRPGTGGPLPEALTGDGPHDARLVYGPQASRNTAFTLFQSPPGTSSCERLGADNLCCHPSVVMSLDWLWVAGNGTINRALDTNDASSCAIPCPNSSYRMYGKKKYLT
jgi:hypothetical protein